MDSQCSVVKQVKPQPALQEDNTGEGGTGKQESEVNPQPAVQKYNTGEGCTGKKESKVNPQSEVDKVSTEEGSTGGNELKCSSDVTSQNDQQNSTSDGREVGSNEDTLRRSDVTSQYNQQISMTDSKEDDSDADFLDCPEGTSQPYDTDEEFTTKDGSEVDTQGTLQTDDTEHSCTGGNESKMFLSVPYSTGMHLGMTVNCSEFAKSSTHITGQHVHEEINQTIASYSFPKTMEDVCKHLDITPVYAKKVEAGAIKDSVVEACLRKINEKSVFTAIFLVRYTKMNSILADPRNTREKQTADEEFFIHTLSRGNQLVVIMELFYDFNQDEEFSIREDFFPNLTGDYGDFIIESGEIRRSMEYLQDKMKQSRHRDLRCDILYGSFSELKRYPGSPLAMLQTVMHFICKCQSYEKHYKNKCPGTCNAINMKLVKGNVVEDNKKQAQENDNSMESYEFPLYYVQAILHPTKPVDEEVRICYKKKLKEMPIPKLDMEPSMQRPVTQTVTPELPHGRDMAFMVFGQTGHGKSATANTLIGHKVFKTSSDPNSATLTSTSYTKVFDKRNILIVDTPGICSTTLYDDSSVKRASEGFARAMDLSKTGFDALLFVIAYGHKMTAEVNTSIQQLKDILGDDVFKKHSILVVTGKDVFESGHPHPATFNDWSKRQKGNLAALFEDFNYRCFAVNNKDHNPLEQRKLLIDLVTMVGDKKIPRYTKLTFDKSKQSRKLLEKDMKLQSMISIINMLGSKIEAIINLSYGNRTDRQRALQEIKYQRHAMKYLIKQNKDDESLKYVLQPILNLNLNNINWDTDRDKVLDVQRAMELNFNAILLRN